MPPGWIRLLAFAAIAASGLLGSEAAVADTDGAANSLHQLDPGTGLIMSSVPVTLGGTAVNGVSGLATHPATGALWGIFRVANRRYLGTVNPDTGVATSVGQLADSFAGITFMPEPSASVGLAAGAIAVALGARYRSRWRCKPPRARPSPADRDRSSAPARRGSPT